MASTLVLDGGVGHLLKFKGIVIPRLPDDRSFLASCLACCFHPEQVIAVHREYIQAGCDVITTNSFVATPYHMQGVDMGVDYLDVTRVPIAPG